MGHEDDHQLSAAYALNALDADERAAFEEHLRSCETCRSDAAEFRDTTAMLAYAVAGAEPPPALRSRILDEVRAERRVVVPIRRRPRLVVGAVSGLAAAAAAAAIVLAVWASSLSSDLDETRAALAVLGDPAARTVALEGASGRLVVDSEGQAALVVRGLDAAPPGRTYEVWIIAGDTPRPAGLFRGEEVRDLVLVDGTVPSGAVVAVTQEAAGGADAPTGEPLFTAQA
jgi:anti-sigma-K factor RskA